MGVSTCEVCGKSKSYRTFCQAQTRIIVDRGQKASLKSINKIQLCKDCYSFNKITNSLPNYVVLEVRDGVEKRIR